MSLDRKFVLGLKRSGKYSCPNCQHTRIKNKRDTPLSVTIKSDCVLYNCFHCQERGAEYYEETYKQRNTIRRKEGDKSKNTNRNEVRKRFGTVW